MPEYKTETLLHPTHPLFAQFRQPACPVCMTELLPMTPVHIEELDDGRYLTVHEECAEEGATA